MIKLNIPNHFDLTWRTEKHSRHSASKKFRLSKNSELQLHHYNNPVQKK